MTDDDVLNLTYRRAYHAAWLALERRYDVRTLADRVDVEALVRDVAAELRHDAERLADPRTAEAVREGVEDALAKRRPRR